MLKSKLALIALMFAERRGRRRGTGHTRFERGQGSQSMQLPFILPWGQESGQELQSLQPPFSFPCGQGLQSAQLPFTFPCGQGVHSAQWCFVLPWGHGLQSTHWRFCLPCDHRFIPITPGHSLSAARRVVCSVNSERGVVAF